MRMVFAVLAAVFSNFYGQYNPALIAQAAVNIRHGTLFKLFG